MRTACNPGYCETVLCLSNHSATCLTAQDVEGAIEAAAAAIGAAYVIYQWIINSKGHNTAQSKGDNDTSGSDPGDQSSGLCLASAPTPTDANDRVYYTSNCFGSKYASWVCDATSKYDCEWLNVAALDEHRDFMLTTRNLREYAYEYTKPLTYGYWQKYTIFGINPPGSPGFA